MPIDQQPVAGQRWVSDTEPELGLGIILRAEFGRVEIFFPAANEQRQYALKTAPLRRVQFKEGDRIKLHDGANLVVDTVENQKGLLVYNAGGREVAEAELSDLISFSTPEDRLLAGQVDDLNTYNLRVEALRRRSQIRQSPVRGFVGARVDLIPHQMFIASEVASRLVPRVLLADEVGLGKTIEAGLILHRLHLTGRAERILILVPEPLIHQWFVELLRRFNLLFSIFDEERCEAIELNNPDTNPFLDSQLVLTSVGFLAENPERAAQALQAGWQLLVVDEAHHLEWSAKGASPQYLLVEALAKHTQGLLLLTATPQQLGPEGHFARLRLLDPERYSDLRKFLKEAEHYERVAKAVDHLLDGKALTKTDQKLFGEQSARIRKHAEELVKGDESARARLISDLLDSFGTGRVMFRNTRAALSGFPERKAKLFPLEAKGDADPVLVKVKWLAGLLKDLGTDKVLLICRTRQLAEQIYEQVQRELNVSCSLFHEDLTLLQRDRNAAFFAEEEGARILICSEIGSEGRNFQFAHHLVLFDLPDDPELLEQRIGRLDRIGQTATIRIYVPYLRGTESEVLARWYHEGLNAFEENLHGATEILHSLEKERAALLEVFDAERLKEFIAHSKEERAQVTKKLEKGHDRLLELSSCRGERAEEVIRQIRLLDNDPGFEDFLLRLLDHFGLHTEDLGNRSYLLLPGHLITDAFPSMPPEGMSGTLDRARALGRDDLGFLTWDHPVVRSSLDLLLGSEAGNSAYGIWKHPAGEAIFLEIHAVVECIAPAALHVDRFLPATPIRVLVDHAQNDLTDDEELAEAKLEKGDVFRLLDRGAVKKKLFPAMLEKAQALAAEKMALIVDGATTAMELQLQAEIDRLEDLQQINDHVRPEEVEAVRKQKEELRAALATARPRLDALKLIFRMT
ncbi:RNA polymerase-associated protein RapA [Verrucomicrobiota bacterium sgz303538]